MKKLYALPVLALMMLAVLSGCMFPNNELAKNKTPNEEQLKMVQSAVEQYQEKTNGLVPIKTKDNDVAYYEKYLVDFNKLLDEQLLSETPGTAYENGGIYQYTLIDPEEDVQVKLIDLRISESLREVHTKVNTYRSKHKYPPFGEQLADGVYKLNYKKLGYKEEPVVVSPYTQHNLPLILTESGDIFVDYRIDLQDTLDEYNPDVKEGEDIRSILTDYYPFVPAYSMPYTVKDGEPVFLTDDE